jgi:hypothetical protein
VGRVASRIAGAEDIQTRPLLPARMDDRMISVMNRGLRGLDPVHSDARLGPLVQFESPKVGAYGATRAG